MSSTREAAVRDVLNRTFQGARDEITRHNIADGDIARHILISNLLKLLIVEVAALNDAMREAWIHNDDEARAAFLRAREAAFEGMTRAEKKVP
jgi:hypothetical protein